MIYRFNNMARFGVLVSGGDLKRCLGNDSFRWSLFDDYDISVKYTVTTLIGAIPILAIEERQITLAEPERSQNE